MRTLRLLLASAVVALSLLAPSAGATSYSTDQSDLWYIPAESGWGMQLVQRGNLIFATIFVYDAAGNPTWYIATLSPTAQFVWSGDLYATHGSWLGMPWNPPAFGGGVVGSMTWSAQTVTTGNISYTVNGVAVTKSVIRQTLVNDDFSGRYAGGIHEILANCNSPNFNGSVVEDAGIVAITQSGNSIIIATTPVSVPACTYSGTLSQSGQMSAINGTYACVGGLTGTFQAFEMQVNITGFTGRFTASKPSSGECATSGWFGGVRTTQF